MTSVRKRKKVVLAQIRHNNAWNWSFDKFVRAVVRVSAQMSKAMEAVYAKARQERVQHDHVG